MITSTPVYLPISGMTSMKSKPYAPEPGLTVEFVYKMDDFQKRVDDDKLKSVILRSLAHTNNVSTPVANSATTKSPDFGTANLKSPTSAKKEPHLQNPDFSNEPSYIHRK